VNLRVQVSRDADSLAFSDFHKFSSGVGWVCERIVLCERMENKLDFMRITD